MKQLVRYLIVGVGNTLIGYGIIFLCMLVLGLSPVLSNLIGFSIGIACSFVFNRRFTFASQGKLSRELPRFVGSLGVAYLLNLATLVACIDLFGVPAVWAQIIAGAVYTGAGFVLSKLWVFRASGSSALGA